MIVVVTADNPTVIGQKLRASFILQGFQITSWDVRSDLKWQAQVNASLTETITAIINDNSISYAGTYSYSSSGAAQGSQAATHHSPDTHEIEYKGIQWLLSHKWTAWLNLTEKNRIIFFSKLHSFEHG
jgi:hypothetical protein